MAWWRWLPLFAACRSDSTVWSPPPGAPASPPATSSLRPPGACSIGSPRDWPKPSGPAAHSVGCREGWPARWARALVVNLPGSTAGAVESIEAIVDVDPHALTLLDGGQPH